MKTIKNILVASVVSLFAFASVQAGEVSVSGSMKVSKNSQGGKTTGNGLGQENELAITGSTELDNGTTVSYKQTVTGSMGFNDSELVFGTSYGQIAVTSTGGTIEDIDNITPTAFEEPEALIGFATGGFADVGSMDGTTGIKYSNPLLDTGMTLTAFYTPKFSGTDGTTEDGVGGDAKAEKGDGYSIVLRGNPMNIIDGVDFAVGYENITNLSSTVEDEESFTAALNYTYGQLKVGAQMGVNTTGNTTVTGTPTNADWYKNTYFGAAYAVNDSLSVSYGRTDSRKKTTGGTGVTTEIDGYSVSYTTGGLTIALAQNEADNADYTTGRNRTGNSILLSVAF